MKYFNSPFLPEKWALTEPFIRLRFYLKTGIFWYAHHISTVAAARKVYANWLQKTKSQHCLSFFHCFTVRVANQLPFRVMRGAA